MSIEEIRTKNEIPEEAAICLLDCPEGLIPDKQVGDTITPTPVDLPPMPPGDIKRQVAALSELDDFADVLHTLPFITNEMIEEFGWESYIKEGSTMKRDYLKYKLQRKKALLKDNRTKK